MSLHLLVNETRLQYYEMRQYWFETGSALAFMTAVFIGLFYGVKSFIVNQQDASSLDGLLFGFILWSFASSAYGSITKSVIEDTQKGYIEQLFLCPKGFVRVMLCRATIEALSGLIIMTIIAYLSMWLTGNWITLHLPMLYGILLLAAPSLVGLGLMVSGLALMFKRVSTIGAMLTLALMGLVALDGLPLNLFSLLPFVAGSSLARLVVLNHQPLELIDILIVAGNSAGYLFAGILIFTYCEKRAKRHNLIGQY